MADILKSDAHNPLQSFTAHLLGSGTDLRQIEALQVLGATITTEIYKHVVANAFESIKNPLD